MKVNYQLQPLGDDIYSVWRNVPGHGKRGHRLRHPRPGLLSEGTPATACRKLWAEVKSAWGAR